MKRLLTFLFLLLGLVLLNKQASARQNPSTGDWFMNLPDSACWKSFASTNVFFWKDSKIADSVDWTITGGAYNILYASQRNPDLSPKLLGQKPETTGNKNALTIQFLDKGQYTIKAVAYYHGVKTTVSKNIYVKDCSMATCLGQNTGVGDFLEDFGTFATGAANSVSNSSVPPSPTGYNYVTYTNGSGSNPDFKDNSYTVFWHTQIRSEWVKAYDHTPNTNPSKVGGMLLANSAIEKKTFFVKKAVPVCPGSMYNFSAWFMNVNSKEVFNSTCASGNVDGYHYAGVTFLITDDATGTVLARFKTYDVSMNLDAPTWQEYGGAFKTPANVTNVTLSILNDKLGDCGNDIAIDDISFKYCSPYIYSFIDGQSKPPLRADSLCEGAPVTIKAVYSPLDYFTNPTYQWQYTKDTLNWPAVSVFPAGVTGINTDVLTFPVGTLKGDPNQIVDYYFRVNILEKDNPSNCASPSLFTKISVLPKPKVTISSGRICIGDSVLLTANGGYSTYEWQTTPIVTGPKMTAFPLVNTTFAAIGIADYGWNSVTKSPRQCRDTGYANVIVDLKPTISMTANPTDICLGKQINLTQTHSGAPPDSISWRWQYNGTNIGNLSDVSLTHTPIDTGTKKYKVILTNHTCTAADSAIINVRSVPNADADTIYRQCNTPDFNIKRSTPPADQQGKWMFDGPHKLEVITNTTNAQTSVTGVQPGDTVHLFWIITNKALAACTDTNRVTLINTKPLTPSVAGRDTVQCGTTTFQLNATKPGYGEKGKWTLGTGTTAADVSLNYDTAYNAIATILGATRPKTVQLIWSISNGVCAGPNSSTIKLTVKNPPTVKVTAAPVCNTATTFTVSYNSQTGTILNYVLDVNPAALPARKMPGFTKITGAWPGATPAGSFTVPLPAGTPAGNYDFVLSAREDSLNGCNTTVYFSLSVEKPSTTPTNVTASVDSICVTGSTTLTVVGGSLGTDSTGKAATWKWYTGACPGSPGSKRVYPASSNADSSVVTFNNVTATTTYYVMAPSAGPCGNTACASTTVTVFAQPNKANANADQQACERTTNFQLNGNTTGVPGVNGLWTTWNANAIITNPTLPNATVKVNIGDTATLFWTIANGPCLTTTDTMFISNFKKPVAANANIDQKHCNDSMFTMAANKPAEYGAAGTWTAVGRPAWVTITDTTLNTTKIKVLAGHTATMVWTITNGTCAATTDTVLLTNYDIPAKANANVDQLHCNDSMFTMAANKPTEFGAYGNWTAVGRPAWVTIADTTSNTTKIKVLAGHTATLVWTITNGTCAATTDTVLLTNYDIPAKANTNVDQLHCNDSMFTMAANKPTEPGAYGNWTAVGRPAWVTITDTTSNTTKIKVLAGHTATLVWTITNGTCAATTDTVLLTNYDIPAKANANIDQLHCNDSIFTMAANKPTEYGAYGTWTAVGRPAWVTITDTTLNTTKIKVLAGHTATLVWTITNGTCAATTDTVLLTNYDIPAKANANIDQLHCNDSMFTMAANKPTEPGAYGNWTAVGRPAWVTITDSTSNITKIKVLAGHTATLVWTITNGTCAATTDTVLMTNYDIPAKANANIDQLHCNDSIFTMAANKPTEYGAAGTWTAVGRPTWVTITDTTLNTTKVKVLAGHTATLVWTITNGTCAATTDTVLLTNYDIPAKANANIDQLHCNDSIFTMAANKPTEYGAAGTWTAVGRPTWVTITDTTLNTTKVKVLAGHTATLVWTITNGTCAATTDTVLLTNYDIPAKANANIDQLHCNDSIFTMAANKPTEYGAEGTWTAVGRPTWVTITDTTLNTTKIKVLAGHTATLVWTITNGTCAATTDTVLLTNYDVPAKANANVDQLHCNDSMFTMAANKPTEYGAEGTWTAVGRPAWVTITDTTSNTTKIKVLAGHTATLVWTITNGTCAATTDTVLLTNYDIPAKANANVDQLHCNDSIFTMAANKPTEYGAAGTWTAVGRPAWVTITDTTLNTTKIKVLAGHTATLVWTITNGTCAATTDTVLLTNYDIPAKANANVDQLHCNDSMFTMAANKPTEYGAYGTWSAVGKPTWVTITDTTLNTTKIKVLAGHTATLVWTITNGTCAATTDTVLLTNYDIPAKANANIDQLHCNDSMFTMAANKPTEYGAYGTWTAVGRPAWVTITDTTLNTTKIKVLAGHTATLVWTITNGTCAATTDTVLLTNYDIPAKANANIDQLHCNDSMFTMAANRPTEYGAKGTWSAVGKPTWVTITDTTLNTTKVKVLAGHTATLVWTITNGTCAATTDTVLLTNYDIPAKANANIDQLHCNDSIFTMAANKPTEFGAYGNWTAVGRPAWVTITDTTSNTTKIKVLAGHTATLVWTITNGTCAATTDTVLLTNYDIPAKANANIDQLHCNDSMFTMAANKPTEFGAKGTWSAVGKPTWVTITDTTLNTTRVKVLAGHTATLVWTITNGTCAATTDTVLLTNYDIPAKANANVDQLHCNDSIFTMAANKPTEFGAYGTWSAVGKPAWVTITDTTLNTTKIKVLAGHTATLVWTITNGTCAATTDTVLLTNYDIPAKANANIDQLHCNDSIFTMAANKPTEYGAYGNWTAVGRPAWVTITDSTLNTTKVKVLAGHTATLVWTITNGTCAATTDTVLLTNYDIPAKANANVDQLHCNDSIFTMAANKPTEYGAYGTWSAVGKPAWVTITDTTLNNTKVKVLAGHTATLVWTITNGTCAATTDTVLLTNYDIPAKANANIDQLHCNDSIFTMAANKPTEYGAKGTWSAVGKPTWVTITDTTLNNTKVKVLAGHTATLVWTITNGTCAATTDTVLLTNYDIPAKANANVDQLHCNDSIFTMAANKPTEYGAKGTWSAVGKPTWVTITDTILNTTKVKVLAGHTATLVWTITNGTCAATTDTVLLTNYDIPAKANANIDQLHCNDSIFTMAANKPTEYGAKGTWSAVGKPTWVTITDTTLNNTKVKVLAGHTATLVWTITNGTCAATTDTVLLTNYDIPAKANANIDQLHCNDSIFTLAANKPTEYGAKGTWSAVGKPTWVTITDTTLNTTKVKVLAGHTATLVWTITNGTCAATTDTVLLTNYDIPAKANANVDQLHCNDSIFTMAANKPTEYGAKGTWAAVGKPTWVTITDTTLNTTKVKVLAGHTATLVWTITNGTCAATTDTVLLTNYDIPAKANANADQLHCNDSIFTLAANKPTEYGAKGTWSAVGKPTWVTITDTTLNTTKVKVLAGHTATLVWTITNGTCAATTDTVLLTNYDIPAKANANVDQKHCNDSIFTMAANKPTEYGAKGTWSAVGKPTWVTITDTTLNTTKVKVLAGHTATLVWTITNGTCAATTDTVLLTNYDIPAKANANVDQKHCNDSMFTMAANKPTEYGAKGTWSAVGKPTWVTITDTTLNTTKVKVLAGHTATLVWTITNGTCAATTDTVLLTNYDIPAKANANVDQKHCNDSIFIMAANKPTEYGAKGTWSAVGKPTWVTITDTTLNTTKVKVLAGHTATLVWTITNGTCAATTDTVLLTNYDIPAKANANVDQLHCNDSIFTMAANKPTEYGAKGTWSAVGKPTWVTITDTTLNTTKVKVLAGHTATLVWTITNGTCAATTDTVLLTNYDIPAKANANVDQKHCNDSMFTLAANKPTEYGAKGTWSAVGKPTWVTITDTTLNTTKVKVLAGHTATLVWTITNGTCAATTDTVLLTNYDIPAKANANIDQKHCNDSIFTMAANKPTEYGAYGNWTAVGKPTWVTITDSTLNTTRVRVLAGHTATLVWTVTNGTCAATTDTVLLTNYDIPAKANANIDQKHCNDSMFTMAANKPTEYGAKGTWSAVGKPTWVTITDTTLNTTKVKVLAGHTATLVWTITNGTCAATTDTVLLTNYDIPAKANANIDQKHCNDSIFTMAANKPTEYGAYGTWTAVGRPAWVTITDSTLNTTKIKVLAGHTATLVWTITNGTCAATTDTVLLTNYDIPAKANANIDQLHCNDSMFTMAANKPTEYGAKGTWSAVGKPTWVTITDTTLNTTKVKVLAGHTATLVWTITNGTCAATTDTVLLTNYDIPAKANANIDQLHCNDSIFTMAANKPTEYGAKGTWSAVGKPTWVTITDTTLNTTKVKVLAGHTATLVWTISNGTCAATTDTVLLTNYDIPAKANANIDQLHCNDSIFIMAANKPTEYGAKGVWSVLNKPSWVKITDSTLNNTSVKVLAGHTATMVWTISNGTCAATTDTVLLTNYDIPAKANANIDQQHCNDSMFTMAANKPTEYGAKGVWSVLNKPSWVKITDSTLNTTSVKVLAGHTATMIWTISNGTCAATSDTVLLTNYSIPAVANANADQLHCNDSIFIMGANKPSEYGAKGVWSVLNNPSWVKITDSTLNNTSVKVLAGHTATLVWTISNGTCAATSDTVLLTNYEVPAIAKANVDQEHCNDSIFVLAANKPTEYGAKGTWTVVGNPSWVAITDITLNNTKVRVLAGHTATLVWTITNGTCAATSDTVLLTNYANANKANAGPDQAICNKTDDFIMQANTPGVPTAKGIWTLLSGKATIKSPNSPVTAVTVPVGDTAVLQWAIANGVCDTTFSRVTIINYKAAITANAGPDQEKCNTTADFVMKASEPGSASAKGVWTDVSRIPGAAVIKSPNDPFTNVTVPIGDTVILKWTVTNGTCTSSSSTVTLINYKKADDANAGADIEMCNNTGDFTMAATPLSVPSARGFWSIIKGNAVIKSINSPTSAVNVNVGDTVTLRWTVTNGVCSATWDDVTLINYRLPVAANAGPNQEHCDDATFKMNASDPGVAGAKGTWIVTSSNAALINISDINQKDATITVPAGETAQLTWVVSNGVCDASSSSVTLINRKPILGNTIREDQTVCLTEIPMLIRGIALTGGNGSYTYQWQQSTTGATGPFTNIAGANGDTYQPGVLSVNTWYRRVVASGACINDISNAVKITVVTISPIVTFTPPAITTECEKGKDYTTLFGTPVFSHAPYDNETLTVTHNDVTVVTSPCLSTITRTWTATDRCGLFVSVSQTITIKDTKAPVFTTPAPADITVDCDKVPAKTDLKANDDCAGEIIIPVVEVRQDIPGSCTNNYLLIRTWTAKDECNTGITLKQVITVKDMTAPVFNVNTPADTTVDCDKVPAGFNLTATDNCTPGVITVVPKDSVVHNPANCNNNYLIYRKWTAFDECGNASAVQQIIKVQDTTKPVFSMPAPKDTVVDCDKVPAWPVITATDNCTGNVQVFTSTKTVKLPGDCAANYQEIRTWTVTDECGNKQSMQQIITVQDTIKPVFTVKPPADTTVSCDNIPAPAIDVQVTDNCSGIGNGLTVSRRITTERTPGDCAGNYRIIRTWIAKDACGNTTSITQVVTVKDTTRPVIMPAPADVVIFCQDKIPAPPVLTATDNCDNTFPKRAIYTEDPFVADICNGYTIVRRWSITDACGNKANDVIQRVIINPCSKPQLEATLPSNCSDNGRIALRKVGDVYLPTYTLVSVTPSNVVTGLPRTQNNNVFNLNGATSASFIITDGRTGCSSDTMTYNLTYIQKPMVNLGNDTTICGGNSLVLDAGPANFAYQIKWSTGATTQRININQAGTYWVNVSNGECATTDTIHVSLVPTPLVDIPDTTICRGQTVKLDAYVNGAQYLWSNGSTASSILVGTQEQFWVKVIKSGCITIDTVKVSVNPPPDISLSRDTSICPDQSIMLTVNSNGGRIKWQTGETSNSIVVNQPGGYWVSVSRDNCVVRDTVNVRLKPSITLDLGPDRNICPGGSITLDGTHPDAISYLWNDGDPKPVKQITQAGKYKLAVMDKYCQRVFMDSVTVRITGLPVINLGRDTVMCKGETLTLRAEGGGITGVRWDNGSSAPTLSVTNGGTYTVTVFNDCGTATDDITVDFVQCEPKPQVPNAFSPNGDGRNDVFRPIVRGQMFDYELRIFNRWGELIFMTSDDHKGWDGTYKGVPVDVGTYVWWLNYKKVAGGTSNVLKGEVTVVR